MPQKRILFVDDDTNMIQSLKRTLRPYASDWKMSFLNSAEEALELLKDEDFDIVVSDCKMPGMSGIELIQKVRDLYPDMKIVMLSGISDSDLFAKVEALLDHYLPKPCDYNELVDVLKSL